jgi:hypothetical protein
MKLPGVDVIAVQQLQGDIEVLECGVARSFLGFAMKIRSRLPLRAFPRLRSLHRLVPPKSGCVEIIDSQLERTSDHRHG